MSDHPLVSAVIIFLNAAEFIDEAIQSVLGQTYEHWELLLADDGSTDRSTAIALHYAHLYPGKVRYLEHPDHANHGMSATRNLGIANARGRFIGFLDADDVWLPHKLQEQVQWLEANPQASMVYGRTLIWYSWMRDHPAGEPDRFYGLGVKANTLVAPPQLLRLLLRNRVQTPTTCNALLRHELVAQVGGFEPEFTGMFEDQVFFAKVEVTSYVVVADTCWARYRQHPGNSSAMGSNTQAYHDARLRFLTWVERYLSAHKVYHPGVRWVLWSELLPYRYPRLHRSASRVSRVIGQLKANLGAAVRHVLRRVFPRHPRR